MTINKDNEFLQELKSNLDLPNISVMYRKFASLEEKLISIWLFSADLISYTEKKHEKLLNSIWENSIPNTNSLIFKAHYLNKKIKNINNSLTSVYIDLLHECSEIHEWAEFSLNKTSIKSHQLILTCENNEFISKFLTEENLNLSRFKNYVVPLFFNLLLQANRLHKMLETPSGIPIDPLTRRSRALIAGEASAVGEDILREMISCFLEEKKGISFSSKRDFFEKENDDLEFILEDYQRNKIHTRHPKHQKRITYGQTLTSSSLPRKFREWQKSDPVFEKRFLALLPKKEEAPESS